MKRFVGLVCLLFLACVSGMAQLKIGHVSSEAIMKQLPDAQDAQRQLDAFVVEWQNDLQRMQQDWQKKFDDYDKKKLIMTDQRRADSEKEMQDLDKKVADYRNQRFGQNGDLFNKQNELMKPVQDRVFKAIQDIAVEEGYDYVFDKNSEVLMMYANDKYDITAKVLARLQRGGTSSTPKN